MAGKLSYLLVSGLLCAALTICSSAEAQDLPAGWREPTKKEVDDEPLRKESVSRFVRVDADFNGDGVIDSARLLKSVQFSGEALWVHLSEPTGSFRWIKLNEIRRGKEYPAVDLSMGIQEVSSDVVSYACFEDRKDCQFGDKKAAPKLRLKDPAIMYFKFESAASMYFWSGKHNRFLKVWLSD